MSLPSKASIHWDPAFRIIATRFPAVDLWEGMDQVIWERLNVVEAMTNPRLITGATGSSSYIQWPFANPRPGRFSTETLGAFYAAKDQVTAIAETIHHATIRCREDHLDPHEFDMRVLSAAVLGRFDDLRGKRAVGFPGVYDPDNYGISQGLAVTLHLQGSQGIVFDSVRSSTHGHCVAVFEPSVVTRCSHLRYLTYRWDGSFVEVIYEKTPLPDTGAGPQTGKSNPPEI